jgi:hypothetical protein
MYIYVLKTENMQHKQIHTKCGWERIQVSTPPMQHNKDLNSVHKCTSLTVQEHFIVYCRCKDVIKVFMFLLSVYSLMRTATLCTTAPFVTVLEHFIAYCRCNEFVKLFRLLLSQYRTMGTEAIWRMPFS